MQGKSPNKKVNGQPIFNCLNGFTYSYSQSVFPEKIQSKERNEAQAINAARPKHATDVIGRVIRTVAGRVPSTENYEGLHHVNVGITMTGRTEGAGRSHKVRPSIQSRQPNYLPKRAR
jgi:hypothetical protein